MQRRSNILWLALMLVSALVFVFGASRLRGSSTISHALPPAPSIPATGALLRTATPDPAATLLTGTPLQPGSPEDTPTPTRFVIIAMTDVEAGDVPNDAPPEPTSTPDMLGTLIVQATGTAAAFDARAAADNATATAQSSMSAPLTPLAQPFVVQDRAGGVLGSGEIRLYAPKQMALDEAGEVRIEIVVDAPIPGLALTLNPPYTATPALGSPRPTPTPMALTDRQFVTVREYMSALLGGADISHFLIDPVPPDGLRRMQTDAVNWWKWNIRPNSEASVGSNRLEVRLSLPQTLDNGEDVSTEVNLLPFEIVVVREIGFSAGDVAQGAFNAAGILATLGGAAGFVLAIYELMVKRFRRRSAEVKTPPG